MRAAGALEMLAALEAEAQRGRGAPKGRGRIVGGGMLTPARVVPMTKPRVQERRGGRVKYSEREKAALLATVDAIMAREGVRVGEAIHMMLAGEVAQGKLVGEQLKREHSAMRMLYYRAKREAEGSR